MLNYLTLALTIALALAITRAILPLLIIGLLAIVVWVDVGLRIAWAAVEVAWDWLRD